MVNDKKRDALFFGSTAYFCREPKYTMHMLLSIKQDNMTISVDLPERESSPTCEDVIIAFLDITSRVYSEEQVTKSYYKVDPDTFSLRDE